MACFVGSAGVRDSYDVVVVGAGVAGCCCARELARYDLDVLVLEAGDDIACGATRANSGIVHGGYDPEPGTAKARYNVAGSKLFPQWADELGFAYIHNESLVVGFDDEDETALAGLLERGRANGVDGLSIISGDEARGLEPALSPEVTCALRVSTGAICDPYEVAFASLENAVENGVSVAFDARVSKLAREGEGFSVALVDGKVIRARAVVNAAGVHSDELHNQLSARKIHITPVRGEYNLYDNSLETHFSRTVFQVPTAAGKGVLVSRTVHGNLFVGPSAVAQDDKDALATTAEGLAAVVAGAKRTWPGASTRDVITNFTGVRAKGDTHDFVIGEPDDAPGLFDIACLESPGLSSAPAIGADIAAQVAARLGAGERAGFEARREPRQRLRHMDTEQREQAVAADPAWGHVVCRCNEVSEAEVVRELHGTLPVLCLDAIKWRTAATMGRCHGGFCTPELVRIIARETGLRPSELEKRGRGSWMVSRERPDYVELAQAEGNAPQVDGVSCEREDGASAAEPYDVVVVGGGAAGMAAAAAARDAGAARVLLVDREPTLGGIMRQCVHNGFGLKRFSEELSGPEFAAREAARLDGVEVWPGTSVLGIERAHGTGGADGAGAAAALHALELVRPEGACRVLARAVVLATGSRERGFGALGIAGDRSSGIYTAGSAQALINLQGCLPGKRAVILGSGDIGLIMARRMTLEGMEVEGVYELLAHPSGLRRNIVQCLDDFQIPLHLSHTVVATHGRTRLESVDIAEVDPATRRPIPGTEVNVECDTLVLSCGLIPENELAREAGVELCGGTGGAVVDELLATSVPGIFACGNALHVHDLADLAAGEGDVAGASAAVWAASVAAGEGAADDVLRIPVRQGEGVGAVVPQLVRADERGAVALTFRPGHVAQNVRFEVAAVAADGTETPLKSRRARVAVPAEMERLEVSIADVAKPDHLEVRMVDAPVRVATAAGMPVSKGGE
ncbi:FAD-dependent oxidoreductase [uncultured Parolsenella sp.]|uniref:FAD-dependent oxidoreductase n=1 Tax=uncultured Parolsenella sp. TaxID=2083008 RepID=UPI0025D37534|nr:FAD-dependent oxidoreductase [uncultured Parolsenella sp.]